MQEGLHLMAVGMSTVFVFLTTLVGAMYANAALVARFAPDPPPPAPAPETDEEAAIAVVLAAIARSQS